MDHLEPTQEHADKEGEENNCGPNHLKIKLLIEDPLQGFDLNHKSHNACVSMIEDHISQPLNRQN